MVKRGSPPDFKSQVGAFLRTTLQQLDSVKEVVVQKSRLGRIHLDVTLLRRKRKDALAHLGAAALELARAGRLDEADFPELGEPLAQLSELEERIEAEERRARAASAGLPVDADYSDWREAARRAAEAAPDDLEEYAEDAEDLPAYATRRGAAPEPDEADASDDGDEDEEVSPRRPVPHTPSRRKK